MLFLVFITVKKLYLISLKKQFLIRERGVGKESYKVRRTLQGKKNENKMEIERIKNSVPDLPKININTHGAILQPKGLRDIASLQEKSSLVICHLLVLSGHCLLCLLHSCF